MYDAFGDGVPLSSSEIGLSRLQWSVSCRKFALGTQFFNAILRAGSLRLDKISFPSFTDTLFYASLFSTLCIILAPTDSSQGQ